MAKIGLMHPVYAPVETDPDGSPITYGKGAVLGHAISADVTFTANDSSLYGDNKEIETDNSLTGAEITFGVDDIMEEDRVTLLGVQKKGTGDDVSYIDTDAPSPYVGFGYLQVRKKDNEMSYIGNWWYKVQFNRPDETTQTKGETIEWQADTITGKTISTRNDDSGSTHFREQKTFAAYAAAKAWLFGLAGITATPGEV